MSTLQALRIVLIEDNEADVFLIQESLRKHGIAFELVHYASGDSAVRSLCRASPSPANAPELVLLDLHLPGTEGTEVLRSLREEEYMRDVPIVIISGAPMMRLQDFDLSGADRVILKSMDLEEYLRNVGRAVLELSEKIERQAAARAADETSAPSELPRRFDRLSDDGRETR